MCQLCQVCNRAPRRLCRDACGGQEGPKRPPRWSERLPRRSKSARRRPPSGLQGDPQESPKKQTSFQFSGKAYTFTYVCNVVLFSKRPRWPYRPPKSPQEAPRGSHEGPKTAPEAPKMVQGAPKTAPRGASPDRMERLRSVKAGRRTREWGGLGPFQELALKTECRKTASLHT